MIRKLIATAWSLLGNVCMYVTYDALGDLSQNVIGYPHNFLKPRFFPFASPRLSIANHHRRWMASSHLSPDGGQDLPQLL